MQNTITLYCNIEKCSSYYKYHYSSEKIIGIDAKWRNQASQKGPWGGLLPEQPLIGESYELIISFPLSIDLNQHFWAVYFEPYTQSEGIESELGLKSMLFCLCQHKKLINRARTWANIQVQVLETKSITAERPKTQANKIAEFLDNNIMKFTNQVSISNFEHFSMIDANFQSNCGWTYLIEKGKEETRILAENYWDFHTNIWELINEPLTKEQVKKYGIK